MALLLPNPAREIASSLLCKVYSPKDAAYIRYVWEPHFQPPPTHTWAEGAYAKDTILAMFQMVYTTPEDAARDIQALTDLVASAIPTDTFILFTSFTLREEELVIPTPSLHHGHHMCMTRRALTHTAPLAFPAFPCSLRGIILLKTIRATAH
jgi:hypothetical protein